MIPYPETESPPITQIEKAAAGLAAGLGLAMLAFKAMHRRLPPAG